MNWITTQFFLLTFVITTVIAGPTFAADMCRSLFTTGVEKVTIPNATYNKEVSQLRETISGKLATVWRSEWKTKLTVTESNQYIIDLCKHFLTPETSQAVLKGLDINSNAFTRKVHARLYKLQSSGKMKPGDILAVRDKPGPEGSKDTTFTYYLKPLKMANGNGKHQVRIRTYLREIDFRDLKVGEMVDGFDNLSRQVNITKLDGDLIQVVINDAKGLVSNQTFRLAEIIDQYGATLNLRAPHGKNYKLEIKSALTDEISSAKYKRLGGDHMVQKLDVSLTEDQVQELFAPLNHASPQKQYFESMGRILKLEKSLLAKNPENAPRIKAVLDVLKEGVAQNPEFLLIEGATAYHRTAFETTTGLQTTVDREQSVYEGNMYASDKLKKPSTVKGNNKAYKPNAKDARHVELKVPVTSMENTVGIEYANPETAPQAGPKTENDQKIEDMLSDYHRYVRSSLHPGKFNYIRKNGAKDPDTN